MTELIAVLIALSGIVPDCPPDARQASQPVLVWMFPFDFREIAEDDLLARMILSETGSRILTADGQVDAVGMTWVALNRTRGLHPGFDYAQGDLRAALLSPGQFQGLTGTSDGLSNLAIVANPAAHNSWFGIQPHAGQLAYSIASTIAHCVLGGYISDPTRGALFFSDARYARDLNGSLIFAEGGDLLTEPWPDGRTHFRLSMGAISYSIETLYGGQDASRLDCCSPLRPAADHALWKVEQQRSARR